MEFYVLNSAGVPVRVTVVRLDEEPDLFALVISAENDKVSGLKGRKVFERVLRNPREGVRIPYVVHGTTVRFMDRLGVRSKVTVDGDGDKLLIIETLVN